MVDEKIVEDLTSKTRRTPLLLMVAILLVVVVAGGALFLSLQKSALETRTESLDGEIASLQTEIQALEGQKVESERLAQKMLDAVEEDEIKWSRVISRIQSLIPYDATTRQAKVKILSYNGSSGGVLNLNIQSRAQRLEPFGDVAELIEVFNESSFFANAYVPSITRGETEEGDKNASFSLNVDYVENVPQSVESGESVLSDTSDQPGVSR